MKTVLLSLAVSIAAISSAHAEDRSFSGVDSLVIDEFTGRLTIKTGGSNVDVSIEDKDGILRLEEKDGVLTIAGPGRPRHHKLYEEINWHRYGDQAFARFLDDYPTLTLTVPANAEIDIDDAISVLSIGDREGKLIIDHGYVAGSVGNLAEAEIGLRGPGDLDIGSVRGHLSAKIGGSGSISATSAGSADLNIGGSGDLDVGKINGDLSARIGGSGDISVSDVDGAIDATVSGSGNIDAGDVAGGGEFRVSGSGDIYAKSIHGEVSASIAGSGDIVLAGGVAENLRVRIQGSGDFELGGKSTNLDAAVNGSGSVVVAENSGSLRTSGRGHFRVGGTEIDNDD